MPNTALHNNSSPTSILKRVIRAACVVAHVLLGLFLLAVVVPFCSKSTEKRLTRWWCRCLLGCFGFQIKVSGDVPSQADSKRLIVANHVSWVDIFAINSITPVRFIAKGEVDTWPVLGYLVRKSGTLFINRNSKKDTKRVVDAAVNLLRNGDDVAFFPEGTTTNGTHMLTFKSSILQVAVDAEASVQPVSIRYPDEQGKPNVAIAYAGDTGLFESLANILRTANPVVEIAYLTEIKCQKITRQDACDLARVEIANSLHLN